MSEASKPHSSAEEVVFDEIERRFRELGAENKRLQEQFDALLTAAEKFEGEMANDEFIHFGEFRRAIEKARGSNPAKRPQK